LLPNVLADEDGDLSSENETEKQNYEI